MYHLWWLLITDIAINATKIVVKYNAWETPLLGDKAKKDYPQSRDVRNVVLHQNSYVYATCLIGNIYFHRGSVAVRICMSDVMDLIELCDTYQPPKSW